MTSRKHLPALLLACTFAAHAQQEPASIPVEPVKPEAAAPEAQAPAAEEAATQLDEVMVTATKRKESARKLAGAVSAIGSERLQETGSSNFADYLSLAPGVNLSTSNPGQSVITIRGVSTDTTPGLAQGTVGVYFDDIPLTDPGPPVVVPDIDAFDAERIELLRGPQGALFGSSSLGGALNYIPEAPDPSAFAFSGFGSGSKTRNADTAFTGKLMANMPIVEDVLALRIAGYDSDIPGYIDNVDTGVSGANATHIKGGRAALGWSVTPNSTLRLTGLYQKTDVDDYGWYEERLGDLKKSSVQPEPSSNEFKLASLRYEYEADYGSWAFIGGKQQKDYLQISDQARVLGVDALGVAIPGTQGQGIDGYSAELRFVSPPGEFFDYLAGISYADRDETIFVGIDTGPTGNLRGIVDALYARLGLTPPAVLASTALFDEKATIQAPEAAVFADATFRFTPKLKLTAGGRYYRNSVNSHIDGKGLLFAPSGSLTFSKDIESTASGFNPRVSLAYDFGKDLLVYGLYSKGYRLGGPNIVPDTPVTNTRTDYGPDSVNNYELGLKSRWLDGALVLDVTGFYIDWKQIPLVLQDSLGLFKYQDNVGDARVTGVETSIALQPTSFLTLRSAITWNQAVLLNHYDAGNNRPPVEPGDQLPGSPEWTISNTLVGRWIFAHVDPVVVFIHRYEGESPSSLSYKDVMKGGYHQFDLRAGGRISGFGLTFFGKNLTDERGLVAVANYAQQTGGINSKKFVITPRTFGLELNYSFGP